ncbi:inositol monophosphatase family protein [Catellatospora tritici]|uniref:inositol monophosphatase family protein n=1 Tax=Catellatospora tritici TaxID=2851566 RepID=UPI0027DFB606|nr:inositol monophosphatase family protein [Catellatospora tritici]
MIDPAELLPTATAATAIAVDLFARTAPGRHTAKGDRDMATETDCTIERAVRAFLAEKTPDVGFLGEEDGRMGAPGPWFWVLDPVDGTVNFVHGSPLCGVSLALMRDTRPVLGVIEVPALRQQFTAVDQQGAYENGKPITVSATDDLRNAVVAIGDYSVTADAATENQIRLAVTAALAARVQRVRMHGSAAIDLAWLASGRVDASITMSNGLWDMAAGVVIARESGAMVLDADGSEYSADSSATLAITPGIAADILDLVQRANSRQARLA